MVKILAKLLKMIGVLLLFLVLLVAAGLGVLTLLEYRPPDTETILPEQAAALTEGPSVGDSLSIVTWNMGYGALGDNADFFMDGGRMVYTADEARVRENLDGIADELASLSPDILYLQEVDRDSARSYGIDNVSYLNASKASGFLTKAAEVFAYNFRVAFVPYPVPPIGRVHSGVFTASAYPVTGAERIQLPCPFSWPIRTANLKRCLLVTRIPVAGSDKELVLINFHLEAYDSGAGKIAQTQKLVEIVKKEQAAGNYVIAGGDFNQTFTSIDRSGYPELPDKWHCGSLDTEAFGEGFTFVMDNRVPSCRALDRAVADVAEKDPQHFQYYLIDGFIVTDNMDVDSYEVFDLGFKNSDHNPMRMVVTLR